ncbi:MAG: hypothetical protein IJ856_07610 [Candidatus Methanomethylophilaceae archaeon]|nr:hypothetical protein [Candidatus Methanomethylophilaceae archaeon]
MDVNEIASYERNMDEEVVKRNVKDAVFRALFSNRKNTAKLYAEAHL